MVSSKENVFLLMGSDLHSKEKALEALATSSLKGSSRDLNYKVFRGSDDSAGAIIDHIATSPIFAGKRLVVVKELDKMESGELAILVENLKKPLASTCLVLESASNSILKNHPELNDIACVKRFDEPEGDAILSWAGKFVSSRSGKSISCNAIELLVELKGSEVMSLAQELDKLIAFTGDRKAIEKEDVEEVSGISTASSVFDLAWKLGERDSDSALAIIHELLLIGKKPHEIMGMISWHLKRMFKAKELVLKGVSEYDTAIAVGIRKADVEAFFTQLACFGMKDITARVALLLEADLEIKRTLYDPGLILEFAVIRLCLI